MKLLLLLGSSLVTSSLVPMWVSPPSVSLFTGTASTTGLVTVTHWLSSANFPTGLNVVRIGSDSRLLTMVITQISTEIHVITSPMVSKRLQLCPSPSLSWSKCSMPWTLLVKTPHSLLLVFSPTHSCWLLLPCPFCSTAPLSTFLSSATFLELILWQRTIGFWFFYSLYQLFLLMNALSSSPDRESRLLLLRTKKISKHIHICLVFCSEERYVSEYWYIVVKYQKIKLENNIVFF